jgi:predicted nucleic acid-binding protein
VPHFVDTKTNVLVYFRDSSEPAKQQRAEEWIEHLVHTRAARTSLQVLNEFYVTVTRKLRPTLGRDEAKADVLDYLAWRPVQPSPALVEGAWELEDRYSLSFWDALVVAAARKAGCEKLLTEDLQEGQDFGGTTVVNPFLHRPGEPG